MRSYSTIDRLLMGVDHAVRTIAGTPVGTGRASPAAGKPEAQLSHHEVRHAAGLMRVNHAGEVSAQALYQGQALTARLPHVRREMEQAAIEENDHLLWC